MNYFVKKESNSYSVVEKATEQEIFTHFNYKEARSKVNALNSGVGFNGWTPAFFLKNTKKL